MRKRYTYQELIETDNNTYKLKSGVKLVYNATYESDRTRKTSYATDILSKLTGMNNEGGINYSGSLKETINYVVLYKNDKIPEWPDNINYDNGYVIYYGDNRIPSQNILDTGKNGNKLLKQVFSQNINERISREKIPPFFLFEKGKTHRDVKFIGLLVPGVINKDLKNCLTKIVKNINDKPCLNYQGEFTLLDIGEGAESNLNKAYIDLRWLNDLKDGKGSTSVYAPLSWKRWLKDGTITPINTFIKQETIQEIYDDLEFQVEVDKYGESIRDYVDKAEEAPLPILEKGKKKYERNPIVTKKALTNASYMCENDYSKTFTCKSTNQNYVEGHHLIPICYQGDFKYDIDKTANIVALCPKCHMLLHHAIYSQKKVILEKLYNERKERLKECGIDISFEELLDYYK